MTFAGATYLSIVGEVRYVRFFLAIGFGEEEKFILSTATYLKRLV
ncbi:MAG: hypothetical protein ACI9SK_001351 [Zhongshania sp.]|jgi:hypothetical protein